MIKLVVTIMLCTVMSVQAQRSSVDIVNPRIGTGNGAATVEGASSPFGLVNASPIRNPKYFEELSGLGTMELSGTGCSKGGLGTLALRPQMAKPITPWNEWTRMDYNGENAHPYSYEYKIEGAPVHHEVTTTEKVVVHRIYTTAEVDSLYIVVDAGTTHDAIKSTTLIQTGAREWMITVDTNTFCSSIIPSIMYACIDVRSQFDTAWTWEAGIGKGLVLTTTSFAPSDTFEVSIGVSFVSAANARLNLERQVGKKTFNEVRETSRAAWQNLLSRIDVRGGTKEDSIVFYSALYRSLQYPSVFSDVNGEYRDMNGNVKIDSGYRRRTFYDLWGCVWTTYPLQTLIAPEHAHDVINTMLGHGRETGYLTNWEYLGHDVFMMGGDPQSHMVHDFWTRGIIQGNLSEYYDILRVTSTTEGKARKRQSLYSKYGYIPAKDENGQRVGSNVSYTLEYAMADNVMARIASAVGAIDDAVMFKANTLRHRELYDKESGYLRPRLIDGTWDSPFDPFATEGNEWWQWSGGPGFTEISAFEFRFCPYHDVLGMANLMGGQKRYVKLLDDFFDSKPFHLGNQPIFTHAWLYTSIRGAEWKSHQRVVEIMNSNFKNHRNGIPGNDDLGSTSSWAVWSMIGLYPILDGESKYRIGRPFFDSITISTYDVDRKPHSVRIVRKGTGPFVDNVTVDGITNPLGSLDYSVLQSASIITLYCSQTHPPESSIDSSTTSGVLPEPVGSGFSLRPNPASEYVEIDVVDNPIWEISLIDAIGRIVITTSTSSTSRIDTRDLPPGAYIVRGTQGGTSAFRMLNVMR